MERVVITEQQLAKDSLRGLFQAYTTGRTIDDALLYDAYALGANIVKGTDKEWVEKRENMISSRMSVTPAEDPEVLRKHLNALREVYKYDANHDVLAKLVNAYAATHRRSQRTTPDMAISQQTMNIAFSAYQKGENPDFSAFMNDLGGWRSSFGASDEEWPYVLEQNLQIERFGHLSQESDMSRRKVQLKALREAYHHNTETLDSLTEAYKAAAR